MIKVDNIKVPLNYDDNLLKNLIEKKIKDKVLDFKIYKKSVDARFDVCFNMSFLVNVKNELKHKNLIYTPKKPLVVPKSNDKKVYAFEFDARELTSETVSISIELRVYKQDFVPGIVFKEYPGEKE